MTITQESLRKRLLDEFDYKETQVDEAAKKLINLNEKIYSAFEHWYDSGLFPEFPVYYGVNPRMLHDTYKRMKPPAIFLLLDWVRREPNQAFAALKHEYGKLPEAKK